MVGVKFNGGVALATDNLGMSFATAIMQPSGDGVAINTYIQQLPMAPSPVLRM